MNDGIFDVKKAYKLEIPSRINDLRPLELLKDTAGIKPGDICIDLGSGTGVFALPMAELTGDKGTVYAVDRSEKMRAHLMAKNPPPNLIPVISDVTKTGLASEIADFCLMSFILHEIKEPETLIAEAYRLLKDNGKLVIIEWKAESDLSKPPKQARISEEKIRDLLDKGNLEFEQYLDWNKNNYVVLAKKQ